MIITDLMEHIGEEVRVYCEDGRVAEGTLEYVRSYSEEFGFKRPHYFFIGEEYFKSYQVKNVEVI